MTIKAELQSTTSLTDLVKAGLPQAKAAVAPDPAPAAVAMAASLVSAKATKAEDKKDDEEDKEKAETDDDGDEKEDKKKGKKAADKKDDENCEDEEDKEKALIEATMSWGFDDDRVAREDNDAGDEEDFEDPVTAAARMRERSRINAILSSDFARAHPDKAAKYAFNMDGRATPLTRADALDRLSDLGPGESSSKGGLQNRMATQPNPEVGPSDMRPANDTNALANAIVMAGKKRRGEIV